jgi:hypothetical protein
MIKKSLAYKRLEETYMQILGEPMPEGVVPYNVMNVRPEISYRRNALRKYFPDAPTNKTKNYEPWVEDGEPHTPEKVQKYLDWLHQNKKFIKPRVKKRRRQSIGPDRPEYLRLLEAYGLKPYKPPMGRPKKSSHK